MKLNHLLVVAVSGVLVAGVSFWGSTPLAAMWQEAASSDLAYEFVDSGGISLSTAGGGGDNATISYTRIQRGGGATPSGFGIFGFRNPDGVLLTETSVSATSLIQEGRIYAAYSTGFVNTAMAFVNPNDQETRISFFFTDLSRSEGETDFGAGVLELGPNAQIARFISEDPFNFETGFDATMTFTSSLPVSAIALTEFVNARGEPLYSTSPVTDISGSPSTDTVFLPHFAESGGWRTDFILINPTDQAITGQLGFVSKGSLHPNYPNGMTPPAPGWDLAGLSTPVALNSSISQPVYDYVVGPKAHIRYQTFGGLFLRTGSARAVPNPDDGSAAPIVQVIFSSLDPVDFTPISQASYSETSSGTAFRMFVETSGVPGEAKTIASGFAIHNVEFERANVTVSLTDLEGNLVATDVISIPPSGQVSLFLEQAFDEVTLPNPFRGVLRVATVDQKIAVIALRTRINERMEFLITTTPPTDENSIATTSEVFFPHLVDGGGWSTQTVLFSGIAGAANGLMRFFGVDGQPFDIPLQ